MFVMAAKAAARFLVLSYLASRVACVPTCSPTANPLPIVELPYERHQAIAYNETGNYYTFSNIRYAQPPTGELRFRAPQPPKVNKTSVQNGNFTATCAQGIPIWQGNILGVVGSYLAGKPYTESGFEADVANASFPIPDVNEGSSEDCLFLDVYALKKPFHRETKLAPVLVWIHGGGVVLGSKTGTGNDDYDPAGLIHASQLGNSEGVVFVALNYRLGALGWLAGPTLESDGTANAGLYDQRMALEWIQDNIHLFGGDKNRVTLMGESAGGSSAILHMTAFGGLKGPAPFAQAIMQSPGYIPQPGGVRSEDNFNDFLTFLNVSTLDEARRLPESVVIEANSKQIQAHASNSSYLYSPTIDGAIIPASPGRLLQDGRFDHSVKVMTGYNVGEGLFFADPSVQSNTAFAAWLGGVLPDIIPSAADYITDTLYPPTFDGSQGYLNQFERQGVLFADLVFLCNTVFVADALDGQNYAYEFSVPPGLHTQDLAFTFAFGEKTTAPLNATIAAAMQEYITSFAINGVPTAHTGGLPRIPTYGPSRTLLSITDSGIATAKDNINTQRCAWWQKGLFN